MVERAGSLLPASYRAEAHPKAEPPPAKFNPTTGATGGGAALPVQGSAESICPGCVNVADKLSQKW